MDSINEDEDVLGGDAGFYDHVHDDLDPEPQPALPLQLTKWTVLVLLVMGLGLSLVAPGVLMRLEKVPDPRPFITLHLCPTKHGNFKSTSRPCTGEALNESLIGDAAHDAQQIPLHSRMLVAGVTYIPLVLIPEAFDGGGHISLALDSPTKRYFAVTQKLHPSDDDALSLVVAHNQFPRGSSIRAFHNIVSRYNFGDKPACRDITHGCQYTLNYDMKSLLLQRTTFTVPPSPNHPQETFASNLTLSILTASLTKSASKIAKGSFPLGTPEVFIAFHQYELSYIQMEGVKLILLGTVIFLLGVALWWAQNLLSRHKTHHYD